MKMKMDRFLLVAVTVAIGSFMQGWNFTLVLRHPTYMEKEFNMKSETDRDSLVWIVSMIGTVLAYGASMNARVARRPLLLIFSMLNLFNSVVMIWSSDIALQLVSRFLDGFSWGFSNLFLTVYFMEIARGRGPICVVLPQLASLCGVCLCFVVAELPLENICGRRVVFDAAFVLSLLYFILAVFTLLESPKFLERKGRIDEARQVLQILHGGNNDALDMALLGYGLMPLSYSAKEDYYEEELLNGPQDLSTDYLGNPMNLSTASHQGSIESQNVTLKDPLLTLSGNGSVDEDSLTKKGEDCTPNADASVLTIRA